MHKNSVVGPSFLLSLSLSFLIQPLSPHSLCWPCCPGPWCRGDGWALAGSRQKLTPIRRTKEIFPHSGHSLSVLFSTYFFIKAGLQMGRWVQVGGHRWVGTGGIGSQTRARDRSGGANWTGTGYSPSASQLPSSSPSTHLFHQLNFSISTPDEKCRESVGCCCWHRSVQTFNGLDQSCSLPVSSISSSSSLTQSPRTTTS